MKRRQNQGGMTLDWCPMYSKTRSLIRCPQKQKKLFLNIDWLVENSIVTTFLVIILSTYVVIFVYHCTVHKFIDHFLNLEHPEDYDEFALELIYE